MFGADGWRFRGEGLLGIRSTEQKWMGSWFLIVLEIKEPARARDLLWVVSPRGPNPQLL